MGRAVSLRVVLIIVIILSLSLVALLVGCGSGSSASSTQLPASITLTPATSASLDLGSVLSFTATANNFSGTAVTVPLNFHSSNTAVLTIATNGMACAGTWDSLTLPVVCTPGPSGIAQVTVTSQGVSSPPTTVYVHAHVDNVTVSPVTASTTSCFSKNLTFDFTANAFSHKMDITSTVGPFTWQAVLANVVTLDNTVSGLTATQVQATAATPGITQIFATVAGVTSQPMDFITCSVQSISLEVEGTSSNSFSFASGAKAITATVVDSLGATITDVPLTWSSSNPASVAISTTGSASATKPGGSTIIASCTPPTCNIGFAPTLPIYPMDVVNAIVTATTTPTTTVYVASTGCGTLTGCSSALLPISVPGNTLGTGFVLPATPNSLVFNRQGTMAFLGSSKGLMVFSTTSTAGSTVPIFSSVTGKVLAVSPNASKVIVADTSSTPKVFVFDSTNNSIVTFPISGATAADFSADSLKGYIVAGSTLYVYSILDSLQTIPLSAPAIDVSFLSDGAFSYLAGGEPSSVTVRKTCDNTIANDDSAVSQIIPLSATPEFLRTVPDSTKVLAVNSPGIDVISVSTTPVGCAPPSAGVPAGLPTVSNTLSASVNLGQGSFDPIQFIVASDSSRAYLLTSNLGKILIYNIAGQTGSSISLTGNIAPLQGSLTSDGTLLYVAASDNTVHVIDTVLGGDSAQITFPQNLCFNVDFTCSPDLIAVQP